MEKQAVIDMDGKKVKDIDLSKDIFAAPVNTQLIYDVVKWQAACKRGGNAHTKDRSDVQGSTAKIYRQKGTGRARHGQSRVNVFVGGGCAFGPKKRDYSYTLPKKIRQGGLRSALAMKAGEGKMVVLDSLEVKETKTKKLVEILGKLKINDALILINEDNTNLELSARNIKNIRVLNCNYINVYDLLAYDQTVFTADALEKVQKRLS